MTKYLKVIVVVATVVVAACSGGGSSSNNTGPGTTTTASWAITSFTASDTSPFVGSVVAITASVTKDGAPAPDGTTVTISVSYNGNEADPSFGLGSIGTTVNRLASSSGSVTTSLLAETEGPYILSVRVNTASSSLTVTYSNRDPSTTLQIYQPLLPNQGSLDGGEQVILNGKGILVPAEVDFEVDGEIYPGVVVSVEESNPITADGSITIRTPYISNLDADQRLLDWPSNVTVRVGVSTVDEQEEMLPGAFTFLGAEPPPQGPQAWLGEPSLYLALPDHGQSSGGQQVTLLGRNFRAVITDPDGNVIDQPVAVDRVTFGDIEAVIISVSADGTQIVAQTPRWSVTPITEDTPVDIVVETSYTNDEYGSFGPFTVSLTSGFVFLADEPTPEITAIAPTGGPIDGGTVVTIFGHGFQAPAQVTFGNLEAVNVEVNDDQSLGDQDTIVCVTPDYSQQDEETPVSVDVVVTNVLTGKTSAAATYTYGDNLYISGNTPVEGGPGDNIIIYGAGFESPLQVDFADSIRMEVLSVSGTELLVRVPVDAPPSCVNITGEFTVTLLESAQAATGGAFTFLGSTPQIYGVNPIFVSENGGGTLTITGEYFNPSVIVAINNYRLQSGLITVTGSTQIDVDTVPDIDLIGLTWDTSACVDDNGLPGVRIVPTPVDLQVINLPGECSDTLAGGLVYEPLNSECFVGLRGMWTLAGFDGDFGTVDVDSNVQRQYQVTNDGAVSVNMLAPTFTSGAYSSNGTYTVIGPGQTVTFMVTFAPTAVDIIGGADTTVDAVMSITATGAGLPNFTSTVDLTGVAHPFPVMSADAITIDCAAGSTCTGDITVTNSGTADLTWTEVIAGDPELTITGSTGAAAPGGTGTITIQLDATAAASGDTFSANVTITAGEADEPNSPVTVTVSGTVP